MLQPLRSLLLVETPASRGQIKQVISVLQPTSEHVLFRVRGCLGKGRDPKLRQVCKRREPRYATIRNKHSSGTHPLSNSSGP